jgi:hypothetical protein
MKSYLALILVGVALASTAVGLDREAFTVTHYQLEVQIDRASHVMAVTGQLTLRNDSKAAQKNIALQVSSSLSWNGIALDSKPLEWIGNTYTSDVDHTGALSEAVAILPKAVLPGGTITLDAQYGGTVTPDSTRLTRMGAPAEMSLRNDWDQISEPFTAVRGLGYVVWYPVSLPAVSMSDGNAVFDAIDAWKFRHERTEFDARVEVVSADTKLCIAGNATTSNCGELGGTENPRTGGRVNQISNSIHLAGLAQTVPSFAVADYVQLERPTVTLFHTPEKVPQARDYAAAAEANEPLLKEWLVSPGQRIMVVELTDPEANPYQNGNVLFTPLRFSQPATLELLMMPVQVAASFASPRRWIEDGLQRFLQAVSVERRSGRKAALQFLDDYLAPLIKAEEPASPEPGAAAKASDQHPGDNTLVNTSDEILLRGKGSFVFWMLRDMVGDEVLQHALAAYRPGADVNPTYFQGLLQDGKKRDLEWFFDDWVYRNRGLPDFRVENAYVRPLLENPSKIVLVTVTIENRGGAGAEVPVLIQTPDGEKIARLLVRGHQKASDRIQVPAAPTKVVVNDGSVPEISSSDNTFEVPATPVPK